MRLAALIGAVVLAFSGASVAAAAEKAPFSVDLPPGFEVKAVDGPPAWAGYDVVKGDLAYVGITVGRDLGFPIIDDEDVRLERRSEDLVVAVRGTGKDAYIGEWLWTDQTTGQDIHVWLWFGKDIDFKTAGAIAASLRPGS